MFDSAWEVGVAWHSTVFAYTFMQASLLNTCSTEVLSSQCKSVKTFTRRQLDLTSCGLDHCHFINCSWNEVGQIMFSFITVKVKSSASDSQSFQ